MIKEYTIDDLVKVAKRENNSIRPYLYVNPLQGKHIPVSPGKAMDLFQQLANEVEQTYPGERLLVIGFAETATAIGSAIACFAENVKYYLNTTREDVENTGYLYFTESHSHAADQRLALRGLEEAVRDADRIVFAEDELTTGKTIEKLIHVMDNQFPDRELKYGIISILNSMQDERLEEMEKKGILLNYYTRIPFQYKADRANQYRLEQHQDHTGGVHSGAAAFSQIHLADFWNNRMAASTARIKGKLKHYSDQFWEAIQRKEDTRSVLVIGTEEFMYPGLLIAWQIEDRYPSVKVRFHATTRSPIETSRDPGYPLHNRCILESLYQQGRRTFLYNMDHYDRVIIVTDAQPVSSAGLSTLTDALSEYGNRDITLVMWGASDDEEQLFF